MVEDALWQQAREQVQNWQEPGEDALAIWDGSAWEQPESEASQDFCAVRASTAKRLSHSTPGSSNPPTRPIVVPGWPWLAVLVRFVLRWRADQQLLDAPGHRRKAWRIAMGKRGWSERTLWDSRRAQWGSASVLARPLRHPEHAESPLWLVVCPSKGRTPWQLLTAEPVTTAADAWRLVFASMHRWHIELTWRFHTSARAFQRPRLWRRQERAKRLAWATLADALLVQVLEPLFEPLRHWLLRHFCHRTGWHLRRVRAPLQRLRSALRRLWQRYPPCFAALGRRQRRQALVTLTERLSRAGQDQDHSAHLAAGQQHRTI